MERKSRSPSELVLSRHPRTIAAQAVPRAARRAENSAAKRETSEKFSSIKIKIKCGREKSQDVAATGTVESAVEAGQAAMVEGARQGAGGGESVPQNLGVRFEYSEKGPTLQAGSVRAQSPAVRGFPAVSPRCTF